MAFIFTSSSAPISGHRIIMEDGLSRVVGDPSGLRFRRCSVTIHSWGTTPFSSMARMFTQCDSVVMNGEPLFEFGCTLKKMFLGSRGIGDVSRWNTTNVTDMKGMFEMCVDFDQRLNWDTSNVTRMSCMFFGCTIFNQKILFNTSKVTLMNSMFSFCSALNQPLLFDTSSVTDIRYMFLGCSSFNFNLRWNTSKVVYMDGMFENCSVFDQLLLWDTSSVTSMSNMFSRCKAFNRPLSFDMSKVTTITCMFYKCYSLDQTFDGWNTRRDVFKHEAFGGCKKTPTWAITE